VAFFIFGEGGRQMFEREYEVFLQNQIREAKGQRKERLLAEGTLTGTRILLEKVIHPVLGSFDGVELEYEMQGLGKWKLFYDACYTPLRILFEEDHYVTHAELASRNRFSVERMRVRTAAVRQYVYFPYSRDELLKNPEECAKHLYELLNVLSATEDAGLLELPVYEREVVRCGLMRTEPFELGDAAGWLQLSKESARIVLRKMEKKGLLKAVGGGPRRCFKFTITDKAEELLGRMAFRFR
jgi:hypothetical protein